MKFPKILKQNIPIAQGDKGRFAIYNVDYYLICGDTLNSRQLPANVEEGDIISVVVENFYADAKFRCYSF